MNLLFHLPIIPLLFPTIIGQGCPPTTFRVHVDRTCTPDTCLGKCYNVLTCCVDLCFPLHTTQTMIDACHVDTTTANKTCSRHNEEMSCVANMTSSSDVICHEQVKWMANEGLASLAPASVHDCPCESGYGRLDTVCHFQQCRHGSDCINMTDTYYNNNVCCYAKYLVPSDDICDTGQEKIATVFDHNVTRCQEVCGLRQATCKTSHDTFWACCKDKPGSPASTKKKTLIETADGVIVVLIVAFCMIVMAGLVFLTAFCLRRKQMKKLKVDTEDKLKVVELDTIEEEVVPEDLWVEYDTDVHIDVTAIENSIDEDTISNKNTVVEVTAVINNVQNNGIYKESDDEGSESHPSKTSEDSINVITGRDKSDAIEVGYRYTVHHSDDVGSESSRSNTSEDSTNVITGRDKSDAIEVGYRYTVHHSDDVGSESSRSNTSEDSTNVITGHDKSDAVEVGYRYTVRHSDDVGSESSRSNTSEDSENIIVEPDTIKVNHTTIENEHLVEDRTGITQIVEINLEGVELGQSLTDELTEYMPSTRHNNNSEIDSAIKLGSNVDYFTPEFDSRSRRSSESKRYGTKLLYTNGVNVISEYRLGMRKNSDIPLEIQSITSSSSADSYGSSQLNSPLDTETDSYFKMKPNSNVGLQTTPVIPSTMTVAELIVDELTECMPNIRSNDISELESASKLDRHVDDITHDFGSISRSIWEGSKWRGPELSENRDVDSINKHIIGTRNNSESTSDSDIQLDRQSSADSDKSSHCNLSLENERTSYFKMKPDFNFGLQMSPAISRSMSVTESDSDELTEYRPKTRYNDKSDSTIKLARHVNDSTPELDSCNRSSSESKRYSTQLEFNKDRVDSRKNSEFKSDNAIQLDIHSITTSSAVPDRSSHLNSSIESETASYFKMKPDFNFGLQMSTAIPRAMSVTEIFSETDVGISDTS